MTEQPTITTRPDRPGEAFIHLPEFTYWDTQVWEADLGIPAEALPALRDAITAHLNAGREAAPDGPQGDELARQREQLIEAMSGTSEARWSASWLICLDRILHAEGGVWEAAGRVAGWPTGNVGDAEWTWLSWDAAGELYAKGGQD